MVHRGFSQSFYVSLSDIVTFSFRGQLSLFAHAVLRVLQDLLIGGSFANYLDQNFSTSWLRRCLWLSFCPTVYGNGSDFVSADTCALYLRAYILCSARPFVVIFFTSRALPLFQLVALGVHKIFLLASLYPDLLIDMSSSTASIASVSTLHQIRGGACEQIAALRYCRVVLSIYEECTFAEE